MTRIPALVGLAFAVAMAPPARGEAPQVLLSPRRNPEVEKIVAEVSPKEIEQSIRTLAGFGTRHTLSDQDDPDRGIGAARRWIKRRLDAIAEETGGRLRVEEDAFDQPAGGRIPRPTRIVNLVATLPGTQPASRERVYVVSGHYDSIPRPASDSTIDAPGANDDASGTAAVIELARVLSRHEFDATLVFLAVAGEEQGLLGSRHWAEDARKEGRNIAGMLTNDIVGNTLGGNGIRDNRRVRVFSEGVPTSETEAEARLRRSQGGEDDGRSRQLARFLKEAGERYVDNFEVTLVFRRDRRGRGGDHIPFLENGYAAVRLTEPNEDFSRQHERVERRGDGLTGDVVEGVDFEYVAQVTRFNACSLACLALAPAPPAGVRSPTARQQYDAALAWDASPEPDVAGYRVLWRATDQPYWERSREVGAGTSCVLKGLSKDDVFFAVQAIDRDGNASVPAFPGPPARAAGGDRR
jgi:hypothetical protein